jgi:type IV pilus assembly protein PilY1
VNGALKTYPQASTTAASSHPAVSNAPTLNISSQWDSTNSNFNSNGYRFYAQEGMKLPVGTRVKTTAAGSTGSPCASGRSITEQTITAEQTVPKDKACFVSIPYYPASFWNYETCVVDGTNCVNAPDGSGQLKRYEIKSVTTSYPSGRAYEAELKNFANWFTYYRKRKLMLAGSMGRVLENITGLRLGVMPFNEDVTVTMADADGSDDSLNRRAIAGNFYLNAMKAVGTPTHATMSRIGKQFDTNSSVVQYACQRNSMFIVTDGFANPHEQTAPSYSQSTYGAAPPYASTGKNSLADFALAFYTNQLRTDLTPGKVPLGDATKPNPITNPNLHITTYGLTLGARPSLFSTAKNPFAADVFANPPTWPTPVADEPTMLDDLWHATVNGRGRMYLANDVEATRLSLQSAFDDILSQSGAQGGVAVSSVNLDRTNDSQAYLGVYNPRGWSGDLTANPISTSTADITATPNWSAASLLAARDWNTRIIFSSSGSAGADFDAANVGSIVNPDAAAFTNAQVVNYLRGDRTGEDITFRKRSSLIGAVVNAEPVLARDEQMVYLASGDGMLHAFQTTDGVEQWAYAPPQMLSSVGKSIKRGWVYQTLLDATPAFARLSSGAKMLAGGLGAAGSGYYALDVTNPRGLTAAQARGQFRWIFPAATDTTNIGNMGYTVGKPVFTRTAADGDVVLVTSGYDNGKTVGDGRGRLWMLNAATGAVIKTFKTTAGTNSAEAGLAHVAAFRESNGLVQYAYGGDLLGNVWKFDLQRTSTGEMDAELVAVLKDSAGNTQPVTSTPELVSKDNQRVILVGTGRVLDIGDFGSGRSNSFYAIADGATLSNARSSLTQRTYTRGANPELTGSAADWKTGRGWFFDLPTGEEANTDPIVTYGAVAFVSNKNDRTDCAESSWLYLVDVGSGKQVPDATYASQQISNTATSSRVITLRVVDGRIVGTTHKSDNTVFQRELPLGSRINPSKNAWREIRR